MSTETKVATEGGHWYDAKTGEPRYTIIGKNGKERGTTLRDARANGYVPSVTTILQVLAKPGLTKWLQTQILHASLTLPRIAGETEDAFAERVIADSEAQAKAAREKGTAIHGAIERHILGKTVEPEYFDHVNRVEIECEKVSVGILAGSAEHSFAHPLGFGGKVDFNNSTTVVDFKTKDKIEDGKKLAWDEHVMQLAAYALGLGIVAPRCINVFIGVTDGKVRVHEWNPSETAKGERMFKLALALWQEQKDWHPAETVEESINRQTGGQL